MGKIHYVGKFSGDVKDLPQREHPQGAVMFKEAETPEKLAKQVGKWSFWIFVITMVGLFLRGGIDAWNFWGWIASALILFPHEFLHALCFKEDSYVYTNWRQGMLFVVGTEDMTRNRFVFMSLLPNVVFGLVPYVIFLIRPQLDFLGTLGALALSMGVGDYYNVYNAITQMPEGALTYINGFHSYWYLPDGEKRNRS
ncbi:MAG: DUF3267 domain-containing protein [Firmicutes bacterium]|nr:DUF3267 domain-containing protein [Bacillota bacterium]